MENKRIWELDAFRGICILGMVIVHFVYDLTNLYGIIDWEYPNWFRFVVEWGGVLFLLLSGTCATLGSRSVRRGLIVFGCGMLITAVTAGMYLLNLANKGIIIYFGVLHCLGICMMLWPIFKKQNWISLLSLGATLVAFGFVLQDRETQYKFLMPFGVVWHGFSTADYFPLLPNLGYFLAGAALGRIMYKEKKSLFPNVRADRGIPAFLQLCGRYSLFIYLLHQPIISGICALIAGVL